MSNLTYKQEKFAQLVAIGSNLSDAYRGAYNTAKMKPTTVNRKAKELEQNGKIKAMIKDLREPAVIKAKITVEYLITELQRSITLAHKEGQAGATVAAIRELGKLIDLYPVEKKAITLDVNNIASRIQQGRQKLAKIAEDV
jgi:phage terminase small subunit